MRIIIKNLQRKIPVNPKRAKAVALKTLSLEDARLSGQITICFTKENQIKKLNFQYLGNNSPTDVLAFDLRENFDTKRIFADIVISADAALKNAAYFKTTPVYELYLYLIHGILHILGYDDRKKKDRLVMQKRQEYLCSKWLFIKPKH